MNSNKLIKILTLIGFVIQLTNFIAFKAGIFDKYLRTEIEKKTLNNRKLNKTDNLPVDTLSAKTVDTPRVNPTIISTSKSLIIIDQQLKFPVNDTLKGDSNKQTLKDNF